MTGDKNTTPEKKITVSSLLPTITFIATFFLTVVYHVNTQLFSIIILSLIIISLLVIWFLFVKYNFHDF
ncbi:hypothetical protein [Desertibacillus haloalkaliphilus]|uniref:hypothetical protein n=1 Tax=Desertibacillus haloalkaliphilus TaxID=1328930 RepID=UPI001C2582C2|nr:hypothetical protein [Desertibacillus haloalkaliphilus]MBU8907620.1 hypothetical protein [Desertibacillus haloalkaliphilus]